MNNQWTIRGAEFVNCNCAFGCPCQFNAPSTHGHCEAISGSQIEEGRYNDTSLDGLNFVMIFKWPGEIAEGNGRMQVVIDEGADPAQREAIYRIVCGESSSPGSTAYSVFASTMSEIAEPLFAPVEIKIDVEAREAVVKVPGMIEMQGTPIIDPFSNQPFRARIDLPKGFEYTVAEMGSGTTRASSPIDLELIESYGQFNILHMNQDGVIR